MKLIIAGATGFVATECIRQALQDKRFTSVVALARKEVKVPNDPGSKADPTKLKSVLIEDYGVYSEDVKKQLAGADACIWTVAITPAKSKLHEWSYVVKVSKDDALVGFKTIVEARGSEHGDGPMRFVYMSGTAAERDQSKSPLMLKEMCLMRGKAETEILELAKQYPGVVEACCAKPGLIYTNGNMLGGMARWLPTPLPIISVGEVAAAMLDQVVVGFEKEPLQSHDLARIGSAVLTAKSTI